MRHAIELLFRSNACGRTTHQQQLKCNTLQPSASEAVEDCLPLAGGGRRLAARGAHLVRVRVSVRVGVGVGLIGYIRV